MKEKVLPPLGKINSKFFDKVIYPHLGAKDKKIIIGPKHGIDYGVIKIGRLCLAMSTDPFFIVPSLGFSKAAWFAFHIIFSDIAVSGFKPKYLAIDLHLPPEVEEGQLEEMWKTIDREAKKYNISIITGHTARYSGCNYPMVGGATAIAVGKEQELKSPSKVNVGDLVVITKGPAIETTGLLSALFPQKFIEAGGKKFKEEASKIFYQMSVMDDCAVARKHKGVKVMHDATECGIWGGLYEMAMAGGYGMRIEKELIPMQNVVKKTAEYFGFDPFCAISEGTLLVVVSQKNAPELVSSFNKQGILSAVVGEIVPVKKVIKIKENGKEKKLHHPQVDPYWQLVEKLSKE
ncbi:MAG: AIR synthase family protein [Acidobacteria bacterium]|nr:AIR synthase family protein [Acidobacteriota bacterium]